MMFLASYIPPNPGPVVREDTGQHVGTHQGLWTFTVGENARIQGMPQKMYVSDKDEASNTIYVVPGVYVLLLFSDHVSPAPDELPSNNPRLFRNSIRVSGWQWIWGADAPFVGQGSFRGTTKIRHRQEEVPCTVVM